MIGISFRFFHYNLKVYKDLPIIKVTLKGAVKKEGVYYVRYGVSIGELLEKCGGLTDLGYLDDNFDYNAPITEDVELVIPKKYTLRKKNY